MHVIMPVAGYGTRLRPHTYSKPKPLLQVAGNTVIGHIMEGLRDTDVQEITFVVGYLGDQVEEYISKTYPDYKVNYVEQVELKGQAHAIWLAKELVREPVMILFAADTITDASWNTLSTVENDGVIFTKQVEDPRRFGVVTTREGNIIDQFVEKPQEWVSDLALIGAYYLKDYQGLFDAIEELMENNIQTKGEFFLADALQLMVDQGARLEAWTVDVWEDCGTPEALLEANRYLLENGSATEAYNGGENSVIIPPVHIAPNVNIINSVIGPYVSLTEGCEIRNAILRDTIVDADARIENAIMQESLVGERAVVRGKHNQLNVGGSSTVDLA